MAEKQNLAQVVRAPENSPPTFRREYVLIPDPEPNQVAVQVWYAAQNPTDVQSFDSNAFGDGAVLGCDFVGKVTKTGQDVTRVSKDEVIAGLIWGGEVPGKGAYCHYTVADEKILFKVPQSISLDAAATVPLASLTAWLALFSKGCLDINRSSSGKSALLIWGGSSSVGQYAIQIAAIYDFEILATCSPKHFDHVKSLGAQHVFDYKSEDVVNQIRNTRLRSKTGLRYAFDTIGSENSSQLASSAMDAELSTTLCTVRPGKANTENVTKNTKVTDVLVWTAFLKEHKYGEFRWPPNQADHDLATEFCGKVSEWLENGRIKPNKTKVLYDEVEGGLATIPKGFREHRDGKISGYKIVHKILNVDDEILEEFLQRKR